MRFLLRFLGIDSPGSIERVTDWLWRAAAPLPMWAAILPGVAGLVTAAPHMQVNESCSCAAEELV